LPDGIPVCGYGIDTDDNAGRGLNVGAEICSTLIYNFYFLIPILIRIKKKQSISNENLFKKKRLVKTSRPSLSILLSITRLLRGDAY